MSAADSKIVTEASPDSYLFTEYPHVSGKTLRNRVVMAPLTRGRSGKSRIPNDLNVDYYSQRSEAGLIISEGLTVPHPIHIHSNHPHPLSLTKCTATSFSTTGHGWNQSAAIETEDQVEGWKKVTDSIHAKGGLIACQLWHMGRASHSSYQKVRPRPSPSPTPISIPEHHLPGRCRSCGPIGNCHPRGWCVRHQ